MPKNDIQKMILEYNRDPKVRLLADYYEKPSMLDVLSVSRREMSHSAFLADLLKEDGFHGMGSLPLYLFLEKVLERSNNQKSDAFFPAFRMAVLTRTLDPVDIKTNTEVSFKDNYGNSGRVDIEVQCQTRALSKPGRKSHRVKNLTIVIENKVYASESDDQTERYYNHYESLTKNRSGGHPQSLYNLYVFLSPFSEIEMKDLPSCTCNKFIQINYQDILDGVIDPLLEKEELSERARFLLDEYKKSLGFSFADVIPSNEKGKTGVHTIILAIEEQRKKDLIDFWVNHGPLFKLAIEEKNRKTDESDNSSENKRKYYSPGNGQTYSMRRLVQAIIADYAEKHTFEDVISVFGIRKNRGNEIICECDNAINNYFTDQEVTTSDNKVCYVWSNWGEDNFNAFVEKAKKNGYPDIKEHKPETFSKEDSNLLCAFYDKHEKILLASLEALRISKQEENSTPCFTHDEIEALMKRIKWRKSRNTQ